MHHLRNTLIELRIMMIIIIPVHRPFLQCNAEQEKYFILGFAQCSVLLVVLKRPCDGLNAKVVENWTVWEL